MEEISARMINIRKSIKKSQKKLPSKKIKSKKDYLDILLEKLISDPERLKKLVFLTSDEVYEIFKNLN